MGEYIMVLWPPGSPVPTQSGPPVTVNAPEPDVAKLGGRVLGQHDNKRYILLPLTAAGELRRNRAVAFLQRVWRGESLVGWHEMLSVSTTSTPSKRKLHASPNDSGSTNLQWGPKAYTYDGSGNITAIGADQYVYDTADRLVHATLGSKTETYQYDAFGNLTQKGVTGYSPTVIQVDSGSNRLSGVSYDAAGNVLEAENGKRTYQYDSLGALTRTNSMAGDRRILYDANDERIGTVLVSGPYEDIARWTIRDFDGRLIREYKSDEGGLAYWTWEEDHFYGEDGLLGGEAVTFCLEGDECWGGRRHYHLDHLGSVRLMTDDTRLPAHARALSAHDYLPFGQTVTQTYQEQIDWGDPHIDGMRFAGHWRDFLGAINVDNTEYIDYMHARHYDPYLGRFLSVDPSMDLKKTIRNPQMWNRYSYVVNNPIRYADPDGREHVNEPGFTKSLADADWSDAPAPIKASFYVIAAGFALAADEFVIAPTVGRIVGAVGRMFGIGADAAMSGAIKSALRSGNVATQLEGQAASALGASVTGFKRVVTAGGRVVGEIDVETSKAIVEVTSGRAPGKVNQVLRLLSDKTLNPQGKPVVVYGPNLGKQAAEALQKTGAIVVRTLDELKRFAQ